MELQYKQTLSLLIIYPKESKAGSQIDTSNTNVHSRIINNNQKVGKT